MTFKNEESDGFEHDEPWIQWFCGLKGHEMFCEVERSYIEDGFNLYGLRVCVSNFSDCLDLILDRIGPDEDSDDSHLTQSACTLYGLIHARYIITAHGLDAMYNKYAAKEFGTCPLIQCAGQPVLPVSLKDEMGVDTVKIYCPKCSQVFHPPPLRSGRSITTGGGSAGGNGGIGTMSAGVDGAAFGTTFPHLFLMTFSNLVPDPLPPESAYVPRIFGFRVHKSSRQRFATSSSTPTSTALSVAPTTATTSQQQLEISSSNANIDANLAAGHNNAIADDDVATPNNNDDRKISAIAALDDDDDDENSQSPRPMQQQIHITKPLSNLKPLNEVLDTEAVAGPAAESEIQQSELGNGSEREKQMMLGGIHTTKRSRTSSTTDNNGGSLVVGFLAENSTKRRRRTNPSSSTTPNT